MSRVKGKLDRNTSVAPGAWRHFALSRSLHFAALPPSGFAGPALGRGANSPTRRFDSPVPRFTITLAGVLLLLVGTSSGRAASPTLSDDQFELPNGFHIYRAAAPELTGGSYDICFDGQGRLLVGDGNAVRRLADHNHDGVFDSFEIIASDLGDRGPQGLLVYGDRLYAVGGDGLRLFEGYNSNRSLTHRGRLGQRFNTGGDHDAHTILRGHDGFLYLVAGNGAGIKDRRHITENTSPLLFEREASVFRLDPDGHHWECVAAGGRNPPNLGQNYLGDFFSFDSDMEWHVGLPWYRPVRLNHWAVGADLGWQGVGAYPPYYIDTLPGILDVGRGSPDWGLFYEHRQFPARYLNSYIVCDYRWKSESDGQYVTSGRLVAFFLERDGPGWKASMDVLAKPKTGARHPCGQPIPFALVDLEVAPDGSLFLSDHNQGLWRIFYNPSSTRIPPVNPDLTALPTAPSALLNELLYLPQPSAEWTRLRQEQIRAALADAWAPTLQKTALDSTTKLQLRLSALRWLASEAATLPRPLIDKLAADPLPEIRAQSAWFLGIRNLSAEVKLLLRLLGDNDPYVRRRAAESLTRCRLDEICPSLILHLGDPSRITRLICMSALAHFPADRWLEAALKQSDPQIRMRALVAAHLRHEPPPADRLRSVVGQLLEQIQPENSPEDKTDLLRILALFQDMLTADPTLKKQIHQHLLRSLPDPDPQVRWEQIRLAGHYQLTPAFPQLLAQLQTEQDHVTQFHIAQAIVQLDSGWTDAQEQQLIQWFLHTQTGWFAQTETKGVEFPHFWATVLAQLGQKHRAAILHVLPQINLSTQLGATALDALADTDQAHSRLLNLYDTTPAIPARWNVLRALKRVVHPAVSERIRQELNRTDLGELRGTALQVLARQQPDPANQPFLSEGLTLKDPDVVAACAAALARFEQPLDQNLAQTLIHRLESMPGISAPLNKTLRTLSRVDRLRPNPIGLPPSPTDDPGRDATLNYWKRWFQMRYAQPYSPPARARAELSNHQLHRLMTRALSQPGDPTQGAKLYDQLQCYTCHGGGVLPGHQGRIFGPDLTGVTQRLTPAELADAIVYPSKQVQDRYKGVAVELKSGIELTGFLTEQTAEFVTFVDRDQVHRIPRSEIEHISPQHLSLMPERLLNSLTENEICDLVAFLRIIGATLSPVPKVASP